jgi:NAD(P)-dependent dehydrogenase (short-subunit alcohol dehydrogenase family)
MSRLPRPIGFQLNGKSALVVGGSSGLGLGAAVALADAGATVTLAARDRARLVEVQALMNAQGWPTEVMELDITDTTKTAATIAALGPFDILVNSAGLARHTPAQETSAQDFDAVMDVNLKGAYFVTQAVAKGLIAVGRGGSLINISSQMGRVGGADRAVYCASKFAVEGFTKAMAVDWGMHDIRVNTICPTFVKTPLTQATFDDADKRAWILDKIKLGRAGEVSDIMGAVVYLASNASALVTGSALMVDGGWTAD